MRKYFITLLFVFAAIFANAAYLENVPVTVTQPDGTVLHCFASGDEFYNYLHDAEGYTIIQNPQTGFYVYADKQDDKLIPTTLVAGKSNPATRGLKPYINISNEQYLAKRRAWDIPADKMPQRNLRTGEVNHGTLNNISIFIRFADDAEFTNTYASIHDMFNDSTANAVSMYNYFKAASYGAIHIPTTFYPTHNGNVIVSYQDTQPRSYFQPYSATNTNGYDDDNPDDNRQTREFALLERAVNYINANYPIPTDLNIDYDNDGLVDNVCFIVRGNVGAWSSLLWPHKWELYDKTVNINGKRVWTFNFQLADATDYFNTSTMCHEMNHSLGAPDLYHYNYGTNILPVGSWDLMQSNATPPQHCGAYMKWKYGNWIDEIPEITEYGTYTLKDITSPTNNCYKIASDVEGQYYVLEYRRNTTGYEPALPGSGLLIYRINTAFNGNANYDPDNGVYDEVYIYRPYGTTTVNGYIGSAHFSSEAGRTSFNSTTNPKPFYTNGNIDNNFAIKNVTSAGNTISFTYEPDNVCDAPTALSASVDGRFVDLTWDAVESVSSYKVYRDGVCVGTATSNKFSDEVLQPGTYQYFVRCVCNTNGLLSSSSNLISVDVNYTGPVASRLTATVDGSNVSLSWNLPESQNITLTYGEGTQPVNKYGFSGGGTFYWAHLFTTNDIQNYNGLPINKISFYGNAGSYKLIIKNGSTNYTQDVVTSTNGWNDINLSSTVNINNEYELWVGFSSAIDYPAFCISLTAQNDNADLYSGNGSNWYHISNKISWMIKTYVGDGDKTFNIYRNNNAEPIASNVNETNYTDNTLSAGIYNYYVKTNYYGGESSASNAVTVPVGGNTHVATNPGNWTDNNWTVNGNQSSNPTGINDAVINADITVNADVVINDLYVNSGKSLVVEAGKTLTVNGTLQNNGGNIIVKAAAPASRSTTYSNVGSLLHTTSGISGTVECYIDNSGDNGDASSQRNWHFISSPVVSQSIESFIPMTDYDFYCYRESDYTWINYKASDFANVNGDNFAVGRGYLAAYEASAGQTAVTKNFSGVFNQGTVNIPLSYSSLTNGLDGFNLIGNPYPSTIDWDAENGWSRDVLGDNPTIWIYNEDERNYAVYQNGTSGGTGTLGASRYVAAGQGFFVKATQSGTLTMNDDVRVGNTGGFMKGRSEDKPICLKVESKYGSDEVAMRIGDENTQNAEKLFCIGKKSPSLYFSLDDENYTIINVNEKENRTSIDLNFMAEVSGLYTIKMDVPSSVGAMMELEDLVAGEKMNLSDGLSYTFMADEDGNHSRFRINFKEKNLDDSESMIHAYINKGVLFVENISGQAEIEVVDIQGRIVGKYVASGLFNANLNLANGVYVIRMIDEKGIKIQKIMNNEQL